MWLNFGNKKNKWIVSVIHKFVFGAFKRDLGLTWKQRDAEISSPYQGMALHGLIM